MQEVGGSIPPSSTISQVRPHRLEAKDSALSRRQQGFESPWGRHFFSQASARIAVIRWTPRRLKLFLNWYPPYLGAGVRVHRISKDFRELDVSMALRWYNRNAVGTHFGGSLYSMVDPHFMLLLVGALGPEYLVWDQAASIRFVRPGKGRVHAQVRLSEERIAAIRADAADGQAHRPEFDVDIVDDNGETVAEVHKVVYVRLEQRAR